MEQSKKPNALAELMANSPNPTNTKSNLSASTLKALKRFGPGNASKNNPPNRLEPGKVSAASLVVQKALERFGTNKSEPLPLPRTDWELWAHMPKATLTEAVAVSLGIDPSAIKPRSGYAEPGKDFERRLKLACAFVSHAGPLKSLDILPPNHLLYGPSTATVSLPQFAAWALGMGWELPEKFPRLNTAPRAAVMTTPPAAPVVANSAPGGVKADQAGPVKPLQRTAAQDAAILAAIRQAGVDPLKFPKNKPGKPGVKAEIRTALEGVNNLFPKKSTVFKKAWERLTVNADIVIED